MHQIKNRKEWTGIPLVGKPLRVQCSLGKSLEEVQTGNHILESTISLFSEVLANMEAFVGIARSAAEASNVQVDMLKEIEEGMGQIAEVVQSNSGAAQETSAVSQELSVRVCGC